MELSFNLSLLGRSRNPPSLTPSRLTFPRLIYWDLEFNRSLSGFRLSSLPTWSAEGYHAMACPHTPSRASVSDPPSYSPLPPA